jgi:hypothetical protein
MDDETRTEVPEAMRKIVEAMVARALTRCDQSGIAREDFHRALLEEQRTHRPTTGSDLIERTFRRLGIANN